MRQKNRRSTRTFGWFSALLFHVLLVAFGFASIETLKSWQIAMGEQYRDSSEAVAATRTEMGQMFSDMVPANVDRRDFWADQVDTELRENDLPAAIGFMLAASDMLNRADSRAIQAAADAEPSGTTDQRLIAAARLFLPDPVRARYERLKSPPALPALAIDNDASDDEQENAVEAESAPAEDLSNEEAARPVSAQEESSSATLFNVLGSVRDLTFKTAGWLRGDPTDLFQLRMSGLGLAVSEDMLNAPWLGDTYLEGASILRTSSRAGRLTPEFRDFLETKLDAALPEAELRAKAEASFGGTGSVLLRGDNVLEAYIEATNENALQALAVDMSRIAELSRSRSPAAAMEIIETIRSPRDLKRAELISVSGGDRTITLFKRKGSDALDAAQIVVEWNMRLTVLLMICGGILLIQLWLVLSVLIRSFKDEPVSYSFG